MSKRIVAILIGLACCGALAVSLLARDWWTGRYERDRYDVGIQSYQACWKHEAGDWSCSVTRFAGRVNRMNQDRKEVEAYIDRPSRHIDEDEEAILAHNKEVLKKFDDFASYGLGAGLVSIFLIAALAFAVIFAVLGRSNGARPAGWLAAALGAIVIPLAFAFVKAQPFDAKLKDGDLAPLSKGLCFPLMLGGAGVGIVAGVLLARLRPAQPLFKFLPENPTAFDDLPGF